MKKEILFVLLLAGFINTADSQQKEGHKRSRAYYSIHTLRVTGTSDYGEDHYIVRLDLTNTTPDEIQYRCTFLSAEMYLKGKRGYHFVSRDASTAPGHTTECLPVIGLLNEPFTITVDKNGTHYSLDEIDGIVEKDYKQWHFSGQMAWLRQPLHSLLSSLFRHVYFSFPGRPLDLHNQWLASDSSSIFQVAEVTPEKIVIESKESLKKGVWQNKGRFTLDQRSGRLLSSSTTDSSRVTVDSVKNVPVQHTTEVEKLAIVPQIPPFDRDKFIAFFSIGPFSDSLKRRDEYDSAKVFRFFADNDQKYGQDSVYTIRKLTLMNRMNDYERYIKQLMITPNRVIRNSPTHLFNKLQRVSEKDIDSSLAIISYFYKTPLFNSWIQESYAQRFRSEYIHTDRRRNADSLLTRLLEEKDSLYYFTLKPLQLWSVAQLTGDTAELVKIADTFEQLDKPFLWYGRSARYGMLVFKKLVEDGQVQAADTLLDRLITQLEYDQVDTSGNSKLMETLGPRKFLHRNLLANAYFLKSQNEKDKSKALQYLGRAALYSPANTKEIAYGSFYDHVMLDSKQSYRNDFARALVANGDKDAALGVLMTTLQANPLMIDNVRSMYDSLRADSTFPDFFYHALVSKWKHAKDFTLKDLHGKEVGLKDYKGKWLLLDFWGTWCGPCREEMPKIQEFYDHINKENLHDIALLTIATYDTPEKVEDFFDIYHYTLPVAMANDSIIKHYEVPGYPAKILISPDGAWLPIRFGTDWRSAVDKYVALYQEYMAKPGSKQELRIEELN